MHKWYKRECLQKAEEFLLQEYQPVYETVEKQNKLTAVTSLMAQSWSSLTFSTKNGVIPIEETWKGKLIPKCKKLMQLTYPIFYPVFEIVTCRMVVSVSSWISRSSEMLLTISHTLLYNMTITRCLCVEHFARFALELNKPPDVK